MSFYGFSVWLHILGACVWVGGMAMLALVLVPVTRRMEDRRAAAGLIRVVAGGFRPVAWASLAVLVVTGFYNLFARGVGLDQLLSGPFWRTNFGTTLAAKLGLVVLILVLSAYHEVSGPRASRLLQANPTSPEALRARKGATVLGRLTFILSLVIVALAVGLVRGC